MRLKRIPLIFPAFAVVLSMITVAAFAQRGRGVGGPPMGSPSMGRGPDVMTAPPARGNTGRAATGQEILTQHPQLESRLQSQLPTGTDVQRAASGFKNLGQFVAAVHVSHNLNIPFSQLKARMTGAHAESLGKAIKDLRPAADAKAESRRAEKQAKEDLENS